MLTELTNCHPNCKPTPRANVQLHHEVEVDKNTEQRQPGKKRNLEETKSESELGPAADRYATFSEVGGQESHLEGKSLLALGLPPDDNHADDTQHSQEDTRHHNSCVSFQQLGQVVGQDNAEDGDENGCRAGGKTRGERFH